MHAEEAFSKDMHPCQSLNKSRSVHACMEMHHLTLSRLTSSNEASLI